MRRLTSTKVFKTQWLDGEEIFPPGECSIGVVWATTDGRYLKKISVDQWKEISKDEAMKWDPSDPDSYDTPEAAYDRAMGVL